MFSSCSIFSKSQPFFPSLWKGNERKKRKNSIFLHWKTSKIKMICLEPKLAACSQNFTKWKKLKSRQKTINWPTYKLQESFPLLPWYFNLFNNNSNNKKALFTDLTLAQVKGEETIAWKHIKPNPAEDKMALNQVNLENYLGWEQHIFFFPSQTMI